MIYCGSIFGYYFVGFIYWLRFLDKSDDDKISVSLFLFD